LIFMKGLWYIRIIITFFYIVCGLSAYAQIITTIGGIGSGPSSGDGGAATVAHIPGPVGNIFDRSGNLYFGQSYGSNEIRMIDVSGNIHAVAGNGTPGFSGDGGPATSAEFMYPSITVDTIGNIYIADRDNYRIRKVDAVTHIITTIAGTGVNSSTGDGGMATAATLVPLGLCFDIAGNLYCVDSAVTVRKIAPSGIITTVAGTKIGGFSGDLGPATAAELEMNGSLCMDASSSNLYIECDTRVRKLNLSTGIITTIAGNGMPIFSGDEIPATTAQFEIVFGICVDAIGNLFIADYANQRIRKVDTFGVIHTVAGIGTSGFSGDGFAATSAQIYNPAGVAIDACGSLYLCDGVNDRIRKVSFPPVLTVPTISLSGVVGAPVGTSVTVTATVAHAGSSYLIHWMNHGTEFTTTTVPSVTYTKAAGIDTITARVVSTATYGCYDSTTSGKHVVSDAAEGTSARPSPRERVTAYPNPVHDILHVDGSLGSENYKLLNILGAVIREGLLTTGSNSISMNGLLSGVYVLEVSDGATGYKTVSRIVKE
jgi:type IX secretion system substrate protein